MRGILVTLFSVTALASAATVEHHHQNGMHRIMPRNAPSGEVNCDPSKAWKICKAFGSEGVLVAHENCNQFYKCAHGKPVALKCPYNLLYQPKYEYCDWPWNVDCGDRVIPKDDDGPSTESPDKDNADCDDINDDPSQAPHICARDGSDGILVAHENCTQFYECASGRPVALECPPGLLYNPKNKQCDWPKNVNCGSRTIPVNNDTTECDQNGDENADDNNGNNNNGACNCNPSEALEICARNNSGNVLVAHEKCNKYYICLHGRPASQKCPGELLYNPYREQCDWPKNVECGGRIIPEVDNNNDNDTEDNGSDKEADDEVEEEKHHGHWDPSEAPAICAKNGSDGVHVAHEACNYFYICLHGRPFPVACPHGLYYNPRKDQCDWPKNVRCKGRTIPDDKDNENGVTEKEKEIHSDPSKAPKICAKKNSDGVLVAHEKCNYFYQCSGGIPVAMKCPRGLLFNPKVGQCDWPLNVKCGDRIYPQDNDDEEPKDDEDVTKKPVFGYDDPSQAPAICAKEGSDDILVANEKCNKFYICSGGVPVALKCPKGLFYNPNKEECDWPDAVTCGDRTKPGLPEDCEGDDDNNYENNGNDDPSQAPEICAQEGSDGILISHEYCTKYYICVYNHPLPMKCPKYLFFNPRKNECDWPQNVTCRGRIPIEKDEPTPCNNARSCVVNVFQGLPEEEVYDDPSQAREICARDESEEILVAHEYCNKFYQCVNGRPVTMRCPPNLYFDPRSRQCDWPENVTCGNRIIPEEEEEGTDSEESHEHIGNNYDDPSQAPYICAKENSNGVHVAHEYCNKYYVCFNGYPLVLKCPDTLLYNPTSEVCDWFWNVECNGRKLH